jgi:hypothetical protein
MSARSRVDFVGRSLWVIVLVASQGCFYRAPRAEAPSIDAGAAADRAMQLYDKDGDGELDKQELEACPGLLAAIKVYDADGNGKISRDELANRIASWKSTSAAVQTVEVRVLLDGKPLGGATVTFVPEPYLEGALHPGAGETDANGATNISMSPDLLPPTLKRIRAMNAGTYKVQVTHPSISIPEKYNKQTTLGREVSRQTTSSPEQFELTTK